PPWISACWSRSRSPPPPTHPRVPLPSLRPRAGALRPPPAGAEAAIIPTLCGRCDCDRAGHRRRAALRSRANVPDNCYSRKKPQHNIVPTPKDTKMGEENFRVRSWYNIVPELGFDIPRPLHPREDRPATVEEFDWLWSREALKIEFLQGQYARDPWIEIPQRVLEGYAQYRPTPLYRARGLEKFLGTAA